MIKSFQILKTFLESSKGALILLTKRIKQSKVDFFGYEKF